MLLQKIQALQMLKIESCLFYPSVSFMFFYKATYLLSNRLNCTYIILNVSWQPLANIIKLDCDEPTFLNKFNLLPKIFPCAF